MRPTGLDYRSGKGWMIMHVCESCGRTNRTKAAFEMVVIHRLAEVTNDAIVKGMPPHRLIRVCGNEDRRNRVAGIPKTSVELKPSHSRHLNIADQACGCRQQWRCEEMGRRGKRFDSVAQRR